MESAPQEEAWQHYLQAVRRELQLRRGGLLARLLGAPLPDESLAELARMVEEDRLRAEADLVELRSPGGEVYFKHIDALSREDRWVRAAAEATRAAWLKKRHERRTQLLDRMGGDRQRFEEERGRFLANELLAVAREEERKRIGRELHDRVSHTMAVAHQSLQLYTALRGSDPERAEDKLALARRMILEAMERTRDLSTTIRSAEAKEGLEPALSELLKNTLSPEVSHEIKVEGEEALLSPAIRDQMFLILREAVRNALAHSGMSRLRVAVRVTEQEALGLVEDDGSGFDPAKAKRDGSGGLNFMEERAALVGGQSRIVSVPSKGTRVEVAVPL